MILLDAKYGNTDILISCNIIENSQRCHKAYKTHWSLQNTLKPTKHIEAYKTKFYKFDNTTNT